MYKIYLAVGHKQLEQYIKSNEQNINLIGKKLNTITDDVKFVGETSYREGILNGIKDTRPDLLILREGLDGNLNIVDLIYDIRLNFPNIRIIFLAKDRQPGDMLLSILVQYQIYDILIGGEINAKELLDRIVSPNTFKHVAHLAPKIHFDENMNTKVFEAPDVTPIIQTVAVKENLATQQVPQVHKTISENKPANHLIDKKVQVNSEYLEQNKVGTEKNKSKKEINNNSDYSQEIVGKTEASTSKNSYNPLIKRKSIGIKDDLNTKESSSNQNRNHMADENAELINNNRKTIDNLDLTKDEDVEIPVQNPTIDEDEEFIVENEEIHIKKLHPTYNPVATNENTEVTAKEEPIANVVNETSSVNPVIPESSSRKLNINTYKEPLKTSQVIDNNIHKQEPQRHIITSSEVEKKGLLGRIFSKKDNMPKATNKIITFVGGSYGAGTSQIAFNTAIKLAESGYKVMYMDLNCIRSSMETIFQLGFSDVGLDTALQGIEVEDYNLVERSIVKMDKIVYSEMEKDSVLFKTYLKFPKTLDYLFYSQDFIQKRLNLENNEVNENMLKDLFMLLIMQLGYDFVIVDAPADIANKSTNIAITYSSQLFFVITQDISMINNHINYQLKILDKRGINYRDKLNYILNKEEASSFNKKDIYTWLSEFTGIENLNMVGVPYSKEFINANYIGSPIIWNTKSKDLIKSFSYILNLTV